MTVKECSETFRGFSGSFHVRIFCENGKIFHVRTFHEDGGIFHVTPIKRTDEGDPSKMTGMCPS